MDYRITDFGAIADGKTVNTVAIQKAIDKAAQAGGGRVVVPAGLFISGTIWLQDNVELHLELGAVLKASDAMDDYNEEDAYPQNFSSASELWVGKHLIIAHRRKNIALTGMGTIDGNGEIFYEEPEAFEYASYGWSYGIRVAKDKEKMRPGQMIAIIECENIRVTDLTLVNSPCWTCFLHGCNNAMLRGLRIFNKRDLANTDGIDIDTCSNVTISDCIIDTGDDAITFRCASTRLKNGKVACENVSVTNCVLACSVCAFRIGVGVGEIRNISVSNIVIERAGHAMKFMTAYRTNGCAVMEHMRFSNIVAKQTSYPFAFLQSNNGSVRNVQIQGCEFESFCQMLLTAEEKGNISDIWVKDVRVQIVAPPFRVGPEDMVYKHGARTPRGNYIAEVNGANRVLFENVHVHIADELKPTWKGMQKFTDSEAVEVVRCNFDTTL